MKEEKEIRGRERFGSKTKEEGRSKGKPGVVSR